MVELRRIYLLAGVLVIIGVIGGWYWYPKPVAYDEGFEEGFDAWLKDGDVPLDPNNPGHPVEWTITRVSSRSRSGQYSVALSIDGRQDDGTVWLERELAVKANAQIHVQVAFEFYSQTESFNVIAGVCAYAGNTNPEVEADFTVIGYANEVAGWKRYTHTMSLTTGSQGTVWVAFGITVRWETEMTYHIDDVDITIR